MIAYTEDPRASRTPGSVVLSRVCSVLGFTILGIGVSLIVLGLVQATIILVFSGIAVLLAGLAVHAIGVGIAFRSGIPLGFGRYRG